MRYCSRKCAAIARCETTTPKIFLLPDRICVYCQRVIPKRDARGRAGSAAKYARKIYCNHICRGKWMKKHKRNYRSQTRRNTYTGQLQCQDDYGAYLPSTKQIAQACKAIQRRWSEDDYYRRAGVEKPVLEVARAGEFDCGE